MAFPSSLRLGLPLLVLVCARKECGAQDSGAQCLEAPSTSKLGNMLLQVATERTMMKAAHEEDSDTGLDSPHADGEFVQQQSVVSAALDEDYTELHNAEMLSDANTSGQTTTDCDIWVLHAEIASGVANSHTKNTITAEWWRYGAPDFEIGSASTAGISARSTGWDATWLLRRPPGLVWDYVRLVAGGGDAALVDSVKAYCANGQGPGHRVTLQQGWGKINGIGWCLSTDNQDGFHYSVQTMNSYNNNGDSPCAALVSFKHSGGVDCDEDIHYAGTGDNKGCT